MTETTMENYIRSIRHGAQNEGSWWRDRYNSKDSFWRLASVLRPVSSVVAALAGCAYARERSIAMDTGIDKLTAKDLIGAVFRPDIADMFNLLRAVSPATLSLSSGLAVTLPEAGVSAVLIGDTVRFAINTQFGVAHMRRISDLPLYLAGSFVFPEFENELILNPGLGYNRHSKKYYYDASLVVIPPTISDPILQCVRKYIIERARVYVEAILLFEFIGVVLDTARTTKQLVSVLPELVDPLNPRAPSTGGEYCPVFPARMLRHASHDELLRVARMAREWLSIGLTLSPVITMSLPSTFLTSIITDGIETFAADDNGLRALVYLPVPSLNDPARADTLLASARASKRLKNFQPEI